MLDCCLLKSALIPSLLCLSSFIEVCSSLIWVIPTVIPLMLHVATSAVVTCCMAANTIQSTSLAILTQNHIPWKQTLDFPIRPHYPPSAPRSLGESNPWMGLSLPDTGITQTVFPRIFFLCTTGTPSSSALCKSFDWAQLAQLADPLVLTAQVAFA